MKLPHTVACLLAVLSITSASVGRAQAQSALVVREYVKGADSTDWMLDAGWSWNEGTLTHASGAGKGAAQQVTIPPMTVGRTYRIQATFTGRTKGTVTVAFGGRTHPDYGRSGTFEMLPRVTDASKPLTIIPSADFDGSISKIGIVELGEELVDETAWVVPTGWSQQAGLFTHTPGAEASLERDVDVVAGHIYRVYFGVLMAASGAPSTGIGTVSLAAGDPGWFLQRGDWNYSFDIQAVTGGRLVFTPKDAGGATAPFDGSIRAVSVREITTDPAVPSSR